MRFLFPCLTRKVPINSSIQHKTFNYLIHLTSMSNQFLKSSNKNLCAVTWWTFLKYSSNKINLFCLFSHTKKKKKSPPQLSTQRQHCILYINILPDLFPVNLYMYFYTLLKWNTIVRMEEVFLDPLRVPGWTWQ